MNRKQFLLRSLHGIAGAALAGPSLLHAAAREKHEPMGEAPWPSAAGPLTFRQDPLPYPFAALEPHIDALTMEIHYGGHHAAYVKNVNEAIAAEGIAAPDEASFFAGISTLSAKARNNGGGAWNHGFFWKVMGPGKGGAPTGKAGDAIHGAFGSFEKFQAHFTAAATGIQGSGWAVLAFDAASGKLVTYQLFDQQGNVPVGVLPLLQLDMWEHAFYLDYLNVKADYVKAFWNIVNWENVAERLAQATSKAPGLILPA